MANVIVQTYAVSLFEVAQEEKKEELLLAQLGEVCALMREYPEFLRLLSSPVITKEEREQLLEQDFSGQVDLYLLNFLKILAQADRISCLEEIEKAFRALYYQQRNIQPVIAVTAVAMTEELQRRFCDKLEFSLGKKILLENQIDPSILGGVVLKIGNRQMDDSIKNRLEAVRRQILENIGG